MDVKVRVLYAWPNDQLSPDLADLWPNVGMAMAILDFMSIGIDTKRSKTSRFGLNNSQSKKKKDQ